MSYRDEVLLIDVFHGDYAAQNCVRKSAEIAARADARIAELERAVTVRDTEVARLRNKINSMLEILSDELPKATRRRVGARFNAELDNKP